MNNQHYLDIPQEFREQLIPVREEQIQLAKTLDLERKLSLGNIRLVAGLDVAYSKDDSLACAGITVVDFRTFEIVEEAIDFFKPTIPYIPSFLHLRESEGYHTVIKKLDEQPDLFIFDGNGIIHPYGLGLASQMGLEINKPTMGIAKKLLLGEFIPPLQKGGYSEILHNEVIIGAAYQTSKLPAKPIFASQGHMIDLQTIINVVREFTQRQIYHTKLPLPILLADKLVREKLGEKG
ncbi:MAG: endonuclease V [Candidatus Heimdallarchaeota archaeon]